MIYASGMEDRTISRQFSPDVQGTLLEYVLDSVWTVADELNVVFNKEPDLSVIETISPFGARILNVSKSENPVSAILSAFRTSKAKHSILVTERVPLLKPNVVLALFEAAHGYDLAMPRWSDGRVEPFLAVYRGNALLKLTSMLKNPFGADANSTMNFLSEQLFDVKYLSVETQLAELDPELDSFLKVNDDETLANARSKASVRVNRLKKSD